MWSSTSLAAICFASLPITTASSARHSISATPRGNTIMPVGLFNEFGKWHVMIGWGTGGVSCDFITARGGLGSIPNILSGAVIGGSSSMLSVTFSMVNFSSDFSNSTMQNRDCSNCVNLCGNKPCEPKSIRFVPSSEIAPSREQFALYLWNWMNRMEGRDESGEQWIRRDKTLRVNHEHIESNFVLFCTKNIFATS